jgi:radical SAM/Cys-rich protein
MTFKETLLQHGLQLTRDQTTTLQVNIGRTCDLTCRHCHQDAGPTRHEMMSAETVAAVIATAVRLNFTTIDITGGAPELLPSLPALIRGVAPLTKTVMIRTNLVALSKAANHALPELYRQLQIHLVASLPAISASQTDAQRGEGVWEASIAMLQQLNALGYGQEGSGLTLDLVSNPAGAFLPPGQSQAERRFRLELTRRFGISFNNLLTMTNVPLGRFRTWLETSGNLQEYLDKLAGNFNPATVSGLMCRSFIAVDWDGFLYDCDFNVATGSHHGNRKLHIAELTELPKPGTPIPVADYCYACTAGAGFTCGGSIAA